MSNEAKKEFDQSTVVETADVELEGIGDAELKTFAAGVWHSIQPCI